jgi:hypothetical protein
VSDDDRDARDHQTPPVVRLTALISVRAAEDLRGRRTLALRGWFPSGTPGPTLTRAVEFTDGQPAATLAIPIELEAYEPGTYWFDVLCGDALLTRIPLIVERG